MDPYALNTALEEGIRMPSCSPLNATGWALMAADDLPHLMR